MKVAPYAKETLGCRNHGKRTPAPARARDAGGALEAGSTQRARGRRPEAQPATRQGPGVGVGGAQSTQERTQGHTDSHRVAPSCAVGGAQSTQERTQGHTDTVWSSFASQSHGATCRPRAASLLTETGCTRRGAGAAARET